MTTCQLCHCAPLDHVLHQLAAGKKSGQRACTYCAWVYGDPLVRANYQWIDHRLTRVDRQADRVDLDTAG